MSFFLWFYYHLWYLDLIFFIRLANFSLYVISKISKPMLHHRLLIAHMQPRLNPKRTLIQFIIIRVHPPPPIVTNTPLLYRK